MRLYLENIGKLSQADINIEGITVIAGENNTGKSTVGKLLFSVFNSLYNLEQEIIETRIRLFAQNLKNEFEERFIGYNINSYTVSETLFKTDKKIDTESILKLLKENIEEEDDPFSFTYDDNDSDEIADELEISIDTKFIDFVEKMFYKYREISADKIYLTILNRMIKNEFGSQILNIYSTSGRGKIYLKIKDSSVDIMLKDNQVDMIEKTITSLRTEVSYIDDPMILDNIGFYTSFKVLNESKTLAHKRHLVSNLLQQTRSTDIEEAFHEVIITEKLENIMKKLNKICNGSLSYEYSEGFSYYDSNVESKFNVKNVSAGLKTFAIIKTLLFNGSLKENGTIIMDEPEVHLHPEWQILLAEIIVLLHREFGMHILLTTHSPYFLEAIEVYSQKYEVYEKCHYYLAENHDHSAKIYDVTQDTEKIYKKLAQPFQDLENER